MVASIPMQNGIAAYEQHQNLHVGDPVEKKRGYKWPGVIVSKFQTLAGEWRFVVECTAPDVKGALHIFNADQLTRT